MNIEFGHRIACRRNFEATHWSKPKTYQILDDSSKFQWNVKVEVMAFPKWVK